MAPKRKLVPQERPSQIEGYAFNYAGHAYKHGIRDRAINQLIYTWPPTSELAEKYLNLFEARHSLHMTKEEEGKVEVLESAKCLVVGILPTAYHADATKMTVPRKGAIGLQKPAVFFQRGNGAEAVLVVAPIKKYKDGEIVPLYAPIGKTNALGFPYSVPAKRVYFFREFRDRSENFFTRSIAWNALVRATATGIPEQVIVGVGLQDYPHQWQEHPSGSIRRNDESAPPRDGLVVEDEDQEVRMCE